LTRFTVYSLQIKVYNLIFDLVFDLVFDFEFVFWICLEFGAWYLEFEVRTLNFEL